MALAAHLKDSRPGRSPIASIALLAALAGFGTGLCGEGSEKEADASKKITIRYVGQPLRLPFECSQDDFQTFETVCTTEAPCPVYLQLSSIASAGSKLFVAGNLHNRRATMYSVLLVSTDNGQTWSEPNERIKGAGLDVIRFRGAENGWISGQVLTIPPRDPFFLLTTDGGQHWRRRNVFDDQRISLIEEFSFEDEKAGGLVVDRIHASEAGTRYERYETMTGGADWMIRELSPKPIHLRNVKPMPVTADWRIREDAKAQAWQIDQRQGTTWNTALAFALEVGSCAPKEEEPPEPEPEPSEKQVQPQDMPTAPGGVFQLPGPRKPSSRKDKPADEKKPRR